MTLTQVWGCLLIFFICPILGGLPLIDWITYALTGKQLSKLGTGNISVSAAFYHGGTVVGILAVISEALKGILAVLLARYYFPVDPVWELVALMALVMGRYWIAKGAGTTNVFWGMVIHDPVAAGLTLLIGGISFTIFRDRQTGRFVILFLLTLILLLRHSGSSEYMVGVLLLVGLIGWIVQKIPDDLDLPEQNIPSNSSKMFRFFRGDKGIISLNQRLNSHKVGQKAATLAYLKRLGYQVPDGWILLPGDDPQPLIESLTPSRQNPLVVRSSAIGEDSVIASAAGQYTTILNVTDTQALAEGILACQISYNNPSAIQYRQDRQQNEESMAILIQKQIRGLFSGVAFSRDPVNQLNTNVVIEALPGEANQIVSGRVTPEVYYVDVPYGLEMDAQISLEQSENGDIPPSLIKEVAILVRELEDLDHGIPQDMEWSYDGEQLWILQTRPITTLQPIWTRKIASEVIPGVIRPLTWSINQPLTCGVWGDIFTIVLGKRATSLDFNQTATLHYQRAYFNATLLGNIFLLMGLPPESLEFLTRGAKFSKPPLKSTLINLPGLLRLFRREWNLEKHFQQDCDRYFEPVLDLMHNQPLEELNPKELLAQIEQILTTLEKATYYSILAPLSLAFRQAIFQINPEQLNNSLTPEVASMQSLRELAIDARNLLPMDQLTSDDYPSLFAYLAEISDGYNILNRFEQWLDQYGYLSDSATDIAVPRWRDNPQPVREVFSQFLLDDAIIPDNKPETSVNFTNWQLKSTQKRLNLKAKVTEIYCRLLAYLRWHFVALEQHWITTELFEPGDIFFLTLEEISFLVDQLDTSMSAIISQRKAEFNRNQQLSPIPYVIYGNPPVQPILFYSNSFPKRRLQGIGASPGQVEGTVKIITRFQSVVNLERHTILVVPYTDAGWSPLLAQAGGIIAEVGGRLSHGAIIAREYGIPAVMDLHNATHLLRDGQRVRIDGQTGMVEIL
jgi:pyruvate,water dikinase